MNPNYSIVTNFFIDDDESLQRMKDSLTSFKNAKSEMWIINIRGNYKYQASSYIQNNLKNKCKISFLDFNDWQKETRIILSNLNTKFIFYWVEDHILQTDSNVLDTVILEMEDAQSDLLLYTFYCFGYHKNAYETLNLNILKSDKNIDTFLLNSSTYYQINNLREKFPLINQYITSLPSIFSKKLFMTLLNRRYFNFKLKQTPHFIEKPPFSIRYLPFNFSYLKKELFASIDDDRGIQNYSLIRRKKYPNRVQIKFPSEKNKSPTGFIEKYIRSNKLRACILIIKHYLY